MSADSLPFFSPPTTNQQFMPSTPTGTSGGMGGMGMSGGSSVGLSVDSSHGHGQIGSGNNSRIGSGSGSFDSDVEPPLLEGRSGRGWSGEGRGAGFVSR